MKLKKLKDVSQEELNNLRAIIEDEAWECLYKYQDENDLTDDDDIAEYFEDAMENLWSDEWCDFIKKHHLQAEYNVEFDGDEIMVDFWDV